MKHLTEDSELPQSKRAEPPRVEGRCIRTDDAKSSQPRPYGGTMFPAEKRDRLAISDETIALAFSYHFTWGYPDYMREALRIVAQPGGACEAWGIDPNRDLTWRQLRMVFEEADSTRVRYLVAGNPKTPASVLNFLADDKNVDVVRRVAENRNTHASTLARLALNADYSVRMSICENQAAPELVLLSLTQDHHLDVRYRLAENVNAPVSVIELLTMDENPYVASRAQQTLNALRPAEILAPDFSRLARRRIGRAASGLS